MKAWQDFKAWLDAANAAQMSEHHEAIKIFLGGLVESGDLRPFKVGLAFTAICYADHCTAELVSALKNTQSWQPMSAAPKDGTEIWAYNGTQGLMKWVEGDDYALWIWSDEHMSDVDPEPDQPTAWMPKPQDPEIH